MQRFQVRAMTASAILALAWPGVAFAQEADRTAPVDAPADEGVVDTLAGDVGEDAIVVTAQRRSASLQDVGAAVSVVTSDDLSRVGINDSQNLQMLVPGLVVAREVAATNQIFIRGVGNNILGIGSSNSVATYVDGVYMPNSQQSFQVFNDVERIEVLKGPQAVLYGRNATGGAILITSKAPSFDYGVAADLSYGNYNAVLARATVTGPIAGDVLAGRVSVQYGNRDAYSINLPSGKGQDFEKSFAVRGALEARLGERLKITLAADYSQADSGEFSKSTNPNAWNYQLSSPAEYSPDPRVRYSNVDATIPMRDRGIRGTINWETGIGDVTSVTSYRHFNIKPYAYDADGVFGPLTGIGPDVRIEYLGSTIYSKQFYHETVLSTPADKPLSAIIGANYFRERAGHDHRMLAGAAYNFQDRRLQGEAYSFFTDVSYRLTDTITALAGGRYSHETKDYSITPLIVDAGANITGSGATISGSDSWSQFTPRIGLEFRPKDDLLIYAGITKGFKSGGLSETNPLNSFDPESIWSYEIGVKSKPASWLTANLSAFYYDYTDLQVQQIVLPTYARRIENAASATIYGIEGELSARITPAFRLSANAQYLHGEYGDLKLCVDLYGPCTINQNGETVLNPASNINVKGNPMVRAPRFSSLVAADYVIDMPGGGALSLHGEASYRSKVYWTPYKVDIHKSDAFWILNASVRYDLPGDNVYVALWGQNLTDTLTESHIADVSRFLGPGDGAPRYVKWSPPRTYGVRLGFTF